jgi:hypothetical protein
MWDFQIFVVTPADNLFDVYILPCVGSDVWK